MSHPMINLTEGWLAQPDDPSCQLDGKWGQRPYYNRALLTKYGVDWVDLWCDGYFCPSCQDYWINYDQYEREATHGC